MCGITGFVDFKNILTADDLKSMSLQLKHRGPDDSGYNHFISNDISIGIAHRRLSIIDLSNLGHQPMSAQNNNYWISLNGEIYNYKEIRDILIKDGYDFKSNSDTEVVLKSYIKWGPECVKYFIGMFSFCILDNKLKKIFLFRDRAGIKPLYYYDNHHTFLFASEIKSFHMIKQFNNTINNDALALFFRHGYIDSPHTIYKNTFKVKAGHYIELCLKSRQRKECKYWDVIDEYNKPSIKISFNDAIEETEKILTSAFNYRMVSDVPVGIFLSSGYDSSTVAGILSENNKKINTYTVGFKEHQYDESNLASNIANYLDSNHTTLHLNKEKLREIIEHIPFYYDEPFGDSSAIPSTLVSQEARKHVKVALSADGGDEIFAGYPKHYQHHRLYKLLINTPYRIRALLSPLNRLPRFSHRENLFNFKTENDLLRTKLETIVFNDNQLNNILSFRFNKLTTSFDDIHKLNSNVSSLNKLLAIDYKTYLENDILVKMDRATMSTSLEGREPFIDHRIIEFVSRLPENYKFDGKTSKLLLRTIHNKYIPNKLMNTKKMGFGGNVSSWFKNIMNEDLKKLVSSKKFPDHLLNKPKINSIVVDFLNNKFNNWYQVYQIYTFLSWHRYWH